MTVINAKTMRPTRRPMLLRVGGIGLAIGLLTAFSAVEASQSARLQLLQSATTAPVPSLDPAKQLPGTISVSNIDFKRGDGGAGRLSLRFSGNGAVPDMRTEGSNVVIDVGNAKLPASLQKPIDVVDFATPVQRIEARSAGGGAKIVLRTEGNYEPLAYQTGNEYIVEIVPRAAAAKSAVGATGAVGATTSTGTARAYSGRPVTFNFQDVPVRTVLQLIAEESNLNIVASDTVTGNVTLRLINVPWDQALDIVLRAKGLDKRRDGNVVWVAPQKEIADYEQAKEDARIAIDNRAEMVTEYVPINYGNAEDIAKLLTEESKSGSGSGGAGAGNQQRGFLSGRGSISFDRRTNTLLIIDIPSKVTEIKRLIGLLDKPVDQVLIEARIVIATETFARELGAKFGINGATGDRNDPSSVGFGGSTGSAGANARARAANPTGPDFPINNSAMNVNLPVVNAAGTLALSILNFGNYMLDTELSALQEEGRGEVISNPRIVTSNQKEAVIRQGQEVGYVTISQQQGAGAAAIPNVQFKDVLLELKVTPTITNDGRVFLNMAVKKDEIDSFVQSGIGDVPQINKREVNTAVLINDGQTVVIGGVYEFRDRSDVSKVPWLGDLPVIGNLFKKRGRSKEKAELLIFVTPKVMQVAKRS
jgi:type IV pilus assembly protein PilQ